MFCFVFPIKRIVRIEGIECEAGKQVPPPCIKKILSYSPWEKMILLSVVLFRRGKKCSFFLTSKEQRDSILVLLDCALRGNRDLTQRREMTKF